MLDIVPELTEGRTRLIWKNQTKKQETGCPA